MEQANVLVEQILTTVGAFLPKTVGVLVLFLVTWWVAGRAGKAVRKASAKQLDDTIASFFGSLVKYAILAMGILGCLRIFGFETTSFAAIIGAAGLAVGLAMQGTLQNFSAGVMLVMFRPFKVGDVVSVSDVTGRVVSLNLFTTEFDTVDMRRVIVPNSAIFGSTIKNISHHEAIRVDVAVGADYGADMKATRKVLDAAVRAVPGVLADPAPGAVLTDLGDSSVNWSVRGWADPADYWAVLEGITEASKAALDEAGISIPFPQMDVHLDRTDAS